jgi:ArsR family transcriptional regulator
MAHPKRLEIINALRGGETTLTGLAETLNVSKPNLSQHLSQMLERGIVTRRRAGATVFYRLANPKIVRACDLMREVLVEQLERHAELAGQLGAGVGKPEKRRGK